MKKSLVFSTGLAMFSMFFGSGNLVFPVMVGTAIPEHLFFAIVGILLTGVLVPFLGILGMHLYNGDSKYFFSSLGKCVPFWFTLFALSIMGPFGVLARCITVAHGAFRLLVPATPLWIFSFVSCIVLFFLSIRKNRIVPLLGVILTPLLLLSLSAIAWVGFQSAPAVIPTLPSEVSPTTWESFKFGMMQGYQTMDLLAAFFFSTFIIQHLRRQDQGHTHSLHTFFRASLVGAGLLSSVYIVLVALGNIYRAELVNIPTEAMLGVIAHKALGHSAAPIACLCIALACLTTAIVLVSLFADFLRKEVYQNRMSPAFSIAVTLMIGFCVSTLTFKGIMNFLGPILTVVYPGLIVYTLWNIAAKLWEQKKRQGRTEVTTSS